MPALWDLASTANIYDQQDVDRFNKLPVWMAEQQVKRLPDWNAYDFLPSMSWKPNMGDVVQGVIAEPSPITAQKLVPANITELARKTVVSHFERSNTARVKHHKFESPLFHFLPSFRDFRKKQLSFATKDLMRQIGTANTMFNRWQMLQQSPLCYIVGKPGSQTSTGALGLEGAVPVATGTDTTEPKDAAFFQATLAAIGADQAGFLDYRTICAIRSAARNILGIVPFDGAPSKPRENEIMKGKWALVGEPVIYEALTTDPYVRSTREDARDLINSEFSGVIGGNILFKAEKHSLRIAEDGTIPAPEIEQLLPDTGYGTSQRYEVVPNPAYVNAPLGVAFFMGYNPYEIIDVGPPPSEFTGAPVDLGRFTQLKWNGEVRITDNVLVKDAANQIDTNKYGEYLQLFSYATMAIIANTPRHCIPVFYRRNNQPWANVNL